ncbi:baseplate J/gp47 family protein, partial [Megamonas funiformis]|uniref:baseplate J/gp47 family protein n=1 Tax=Megamonas funiformis TaxID=437897 RepID=UPI003FF13312
MYKARDQKDILQEMINSSRAKTGLFEGTFQYDALASNSIEFAKAEVELEELNKVAFADTSYGEYLTMLAKQYGVIRKEATKAIGVLTVKGTGTVYAGATFATESGIQFVATENTDIKENDEETDAELLDRYLFKVR